jgi:hypothetical protein
MALIDICGDAPVWQRSAPLSYLLSQPVVGQVLAGLGRTAAR